MSERKLRINKNNRKENEGVVFINKKPVFSNDYFPEYFFDSPLWSSFTHVVYLNENNSRFFFKGLEIPFSGFCKTDDNFTVSVPYQIAKLLSIVNIDHLSVEQQISLYLGSSNISIVCDKNNINYDYLLNIFEPHVPKGLTVFPIKFNRNNKYTIAAPRNIV